MSNYNRSNRQNKGGVPARWLRCPRKSSDLIDKKILAFKTPLNHNYDDKVPEQFRFRPEFIFDFAKEKRISFGLWIDLTNTRRFYDSTEIEKHDCKYIKLECRGHGETPTKEQTKTFVRIVDNFISRNPLKYIAVHCTHGFNRTGFLIVSYLIESQDYCLEVALQIFAKVRPPGIYKQDYIDELYHRYEDEVSDIPPAPMLPNWCDEDDQADEEIDNYDQPISSSSTSTEFSSNQNHRRKNGKVPKFMEGVKGVEVFLNQPEAHNLQKLVQRMCGWNKKDFPGSQPVSMDRQNIELLSQKPYRVSWKADGARYMMLIKGEDEVYFFDRDNNVFKVNGLRFVYQKDLYRHLINTLLDGEMVIDKVNGENIPRYLVYDIVMFDEKKVGDKPFFPSRMQYIEHEVINPRYAAMQKGLIRKEREPFSVRKKDFWDITQTEKLLGENFAKNLSHEPDGLIFQPSQEPYVCGRCMDVLKWKPAELNSVDFRLKIVTTAGMGLVPKKSAALYVGNHDMPLTYMKYTKSLKELDNKIVECTWEDNQWKFMRVRTDKSFPNGIATAKGVMESIKNPITKENLISYIKANKYNNDSALMPPPSKKMRPS